MSATGEFDQLVIEGITEDGRVFRPSDWIERLIDTTAAFGPERRLSRKPYSGPERRRQQISFLRAQMLAGRKCLVVDMALRHVNPAAFDFVLQFAHSNHLRWRAISVNGATSGDLPSGSGAGTAS